MCCHHVRTFLSWLPLMQFISRPFVVGDRIEISSVGGSKFVVGVVERVDPMRTIIRTDACMPITIPNKVCLDRIKKAVCTLICQHHDSLQDKQHFFSVYSKVRIRMPGKHQCYVAYQN